MMPQHKFKVGQIVRLSTGLLGEDGLKKNYSVTRLLPAEREGPQYRLKSVEGGQERVAQEAQLQG
jgi:hypothetical protein